MKRALMGLLVVLLTAAAAQAQIGKSVVIRAGTPEDKALAEINATTDEAKKIELLEKFIADFPGDLALVAYEVYIAHYTEAKNYAKVFEYGEKALALDPDGFQTAYAMMRAAQEAGDAPRVFSYGLRIGQMVERYKASAPPEGTEADVWEARKKDTLEDNEGNITWIQYTAFTVPYQSQDPTKRAEMFEQYAAAFPASPYTTTARSMVAAIYQQLQDYPKMLAAAQKALEHDPTNAGMLIMLADYWTERGEQLDKAEENARKALAALAQAQKPEQLTEEQWTQQKNLQAGLANSAIGQVMIHKNRNLDAVTAFRTAAPLLKSDVVSYARNQYRLGFALLNLKRINEARTALSEAASLNTPYKKPAQDKLSTLPPATKGRP